MSLLSRYHPNFCADCGDKIFRLRWHVWTSGSFCKACAPSFRKRRWLQSALATTTLLFVGAVIGRALKHDRPPLIIQRTMSASPPQKEADASQARVESPPGNSSSNIAQDDVYICGARTKKGTPCSRRVHGLVRCWQHKGMHAMLPPEKLRVKD